MKKRIFFVACFMMTSGGVWAQTEQTIPPTHSNSSEIKSEHAKIEQIVEEEPEFPGGRAAMMKFLSENLVYPKIAIAENRSGKCYIQFIVEKDGSITNVVVKKGTPDCPECDKEAVRVVKLMPNWIPAKSDGKAVRTYFMLPIIFNLQ